MSALARQEIELQASARQNQASRPAVSAFVQANAGAGKTHLLVSRVIRLMLEEVEPERILCLTYTRAAAAEMSSRLFATLRDWVAMSDDELIESIHAKIGHVTFKPEKLDLARRLFTRALETPGGLKVQTIHAFCERLLQRFPIEAGITPGFTVLDDIGERELVHSARDTVLSADDPAIAAHTATVLNHTSELSFDALLKELVARRDQLEAFVAQGGIAGFANALNAKLGISASDDHQSIRTRFAKSLDWTDLSTAAGIFAASQSVTDQKQAAAIFAAQHEADAERRFGLIAPIVLTAKGQPKAERSLATKKVKDAHPDMFQLLLDLQQNYAKAVSAMRAISVRDATLALVSVAAATVNEYTRLKQQASASDYFDLIHKTARLLNDGEAAAWVLYKLDGGLDHILIDEAQDTSPGQWQIIQALTTEFYAGKGARREDARTMFAVGDQKQSIYSFQGARPDVFEAQRKAYDQAVHTAGQEFETVPLQISFRSATKVLQAVDKVFARADASAGLVTTSAPEVKHVPSRVRDEGLVEIWDLERQPRAAQADPWEPTAEVEAAGEPANVVLAHRIAQTIHRWLYVEPLEMLSPGQPVRASDILILVRERTSLMEAIVRALKDAGIPVAGADRLQLLNHITAQDLIALGRFVVLPEDDLNLAGLLKSPLLARDDGKRFNDDDDIFALTRKLTSAPLWQHLKQADEYSCAAQQLESWKREAGRVGVFRFFSNVLTRDGGRAGFLSAIGAEAAEPLDAFLQQCLEYERQDTPCMAGFLAWLEATAANLKRDMEQGASEVRVMTVHGAKGLEAPIVFLPDTCKKPDGSKVSKVLFDEQAGGLPVWHIKSEFEVDYTAELKARELKAMQEEYNRLLYVAMTRAQDRLYVCGFLRASGEDWQNAQAKDGTWYHMIRSALVDGDGAAVEGVDDEGRKLWRFGSGEISAREGREELVRSAAEQDLPDWTLEPAPAADRPERWLAPSRLTDAQDSDDGWSTEIALSPLAPAEDNRFRRGELVHRLLQSLPELPEDAREAAARRYLKQNDVEEPERDETVREIMALFSDERFAEVFSPAARAEVSLAGFVEPHEGERFGLSGQIDRLLVSAEKVLIVDFKTNRPPPKTVEKVPETYIRQLAAYAHLMHRLYPDRPVECALLWTDAPELMPVPRAMLEAVWPSQLFTST